MEYNVLKSGTKGVIGSNKYFPYLVVKPMYIELRDLTRFLGIQDPSSFMVKVVVRGLGGRDARGVAVPLDCKMLEIILTEPVQRNWMADCELVAIGFDTVEHFTHRRRKPKKECTSVMCAAFAVTGAGLTLILLAIALYMVFRKR